MLKYVRLSHPTEADRIVLAFSPVTHKDLANAHKPEGYTPASAGFVHFIEDAAVTSGESTGLNLKPHPADAHMIGAYYRAQAATAPQLTTV